MTARKVDRSLLHGESFELFSAAIRSPATRDPYERKLLGFLKRVNQTPDEWCPISDEMLKQMYPNECQSQEGRDRKAETMPQEEISVN